MKLNEEHKKKRTQNWGELICELDCSRRQKNETKTTKLQWKQEFDFFWRGGGAGEVQVAFVFTAVVSV